MTRFLAGIELAAAIKDILASDDVRCAVAYWGAGSLAAFPSGFSPPDARIICDVTRGGTSPEALKDLGAVKNKNLHHVPNLHAKVYVSGRGAVIGSANASSNGIGFEAGPGLIEAGVLADPNEDACVQAATWFETLWRKSKQVDRGALALAKKRFRPGRTSEERTIRPGSLLDQIAADPDRFSEISIVLAQTNATPKQRDRARSAVVKAHPEEKDAIISMPDDGMFIGWSRRDLARWRRPFIELWMEGDRLYCHGRRASFFHDASGTVMSRKFWPAVRTVVDGDLPDAAEIAEADVQKVRQLLDKHEDVLFTAQELAVALDALG